MLTHSIGHSGIAGIETVNYVDATADWCYETATAGSDDAVYAAAGILRALMDKNFDDRLYPEHTEAMSWASGLLLGVCAGEDMSDYLEPSSYTLHNTTAVHAQFDTLTIATTAMNKPEESVNIIRDKVGTKDILLIALGHGGTISSARTYTALDGNNNQFYPVRFSRTKMCDRTPQVDPNGELDHLRDSASDKAVVVHDEDYCSGKTIHQAVDYFAKILQTDAVMGFVPCVSGGIQKYRPTIVYPNDPYNQRRSL